MKYHATIALFALAIGGCSGPKPRPTPQKPTATQNAPDAGARLDALLDELWALNMRTFPGWATYEGVREHDDRLTDVSDEATEAYVREVESIAQKVAALDPVELDPIDRDTRRMVILNAEQRRANLVCHSSWWDVNGLGGPQVDYPMMPVFFTIRNPKDLENLEKRYRATRAQIEQYVVNLRKGVDRGYLPTKTNVARAIEQLDEYLESSLDDDPMLKLNKADDEAEYDKAGLRDAVQNVVRPALATYRDVLRDEVLPAARPDQGIADLPTGAQCYAARMQSHIGPGYTAEDLHRRGLEELKEMQAGMVEVGEALGLEDPTAPEVIDYVTSKKAHYATDGAQLLEENRAVVDRARDAMPRAFGRLPATPLEVRPIEKHRAADAPAAYYYGAPEDGSRPGIYYVNTVDPNTRPLFNLEALAFHEAIPGHHHQIALAQELPDVHVWRRNTGQTAYVEGWALYAEMLADELGLYSDPLTRFGMYNYQAWRAVRLVVDTGLHDQGWSRKRAIEFMSENTALPRNEVENEIDRYIAWPGQALAYMVGRMKFYELRGEARRRLGDAFSLREFHDAVYSRGALPLTILQAHIETWIADMNEETAELPDFRDVWDFRDPEGSEARFRELLEHPQTASHATYRLQLLTQIARTHSLRKQFDEAHEILDELEPELDSAEPVVEVRYLLERGRTYNSAGQKEEARELFDRAWDVARHANLDGLAVDAAHMMGIATSDEDALAWNEKAIEYAESSDTPAAKRWLGALYNNTGWTHHDAGRYQKALELFQKGWKWRQERDDEEATRIAKWAVGRAFRSLEEYKTALKLQRELEQERQKAGKPDGFVFEELAELHLALGDEETAKEYFAKAYPLLQKFDWLEDDRLQRMKKLSGQ